MDSSATEPITTKGLDARAALRRVLTSEFALVGGVLLLLIAVFFYDVVFLGRTLLTSSFIWGVMGNDPPWGYTGGPPIHSPYLLDPLAPAVAESTARKISAVYHHFQIPLWDSNTALGRPLLGSIDPHAIDPLRLPIVLSPSPAVWDAYLLSRFFVAGFFTYLFARRLGTTKLAALAAGIAFMFSGFFMLYVNAPQPAFGMLIPVLLYAFDILFDGPGPGTVALASIAVALSVLLGLPEATLVLILFGGAYYWSRLLVAYRRGDRKLLRRAVAVGASITIGLALSAFALAPFIELAGFGGVGGNSVHLHGEGSHFGLRHDPLTQMLSLFVPYFNGTPISPFDGTGWTGIRSFNYVGAVVPLLAIIGLTNRRLIAGSGWFFAVAAALLLAKAYGVGVVNWVGRLPVLDAVDFPVYLAPSIAFSTAIVAAFGIDQLATGHVRSSRALAALAVMGALLGWLVWLNRGILDHIPEDHLVRHLGIAIALLVAAAAVFLVVRRRLVATQFASLLLIVLILGELFFFAMPVKGRFLGLGPILYGNDIPVSNRPERYDPFTEPPYVSFLKADTSTYRVFSPDYVLYPNTSSAYGIDDIRGFTALTSDRYLMYVKSFISPTTVQRFTGAFFAPFRSEAEPSSYAGNPMFDLLNVKYIIAPRGAALTEAHDHSFIDAVLTANHGQRGVSLRAFRIEGDDEVALFQHPPSSLSYDLKPQEGSRFLLFKLALDPQVWERAGDGVLFKVSVAEGGVPRTLFSRWVDPKNEPADRHWIDAAVDLGQFAGKDVTLLLETSPGANPAWDWAGWGALRLASSRDAQPDRSAARQFKLVYEGEVNVYQNLSAFPRAFLVHEALPATDMESAVELMQRPDFDPSRQAVVEGDLPTDQLPTPDSLTADASSVEITHHGDTVVELRASVDQPALMILSDTYYPGWKAYVDGQRTTIYPTNLAMRSILLEPGEHQIKFEYDPASFKIGWLVSAAALLILASCVAVATARFVRERRRGTSQ